MASGQSVPARMKDICSATSLRKKKLSGAPSSAVTVRELFLLGITEPLRLEGALRSCSPTVSPSPLCPLSPVPNSGAYYVKGAPATWTTRRNTAKWWENLGRLTYYSCGFLQHLSWQWIYWGGNEGEMARGMSDRAIMHEGSSSSYFSAITQKGKVGSSSSSLFNAGTVQ